MPLVELINACTAVADADLAAMVPALQTQVDRDFAPAWHVRARLTFVPKGLPGGRDAYWLVFVDDPDIAGALGYHDLTPAGHPLGKVFVKMDLDTGSSISVTASHELLEMLGNPFLTDCIEYADDRQDVLLAKEACDPCEGEDFAYEIDGVKVSDFVHLPYFYFPVGRPNETYDHTGHISIPRTLLPDGYQLLRDLNGSRGWVQETFAGRTTHRELPRVGSRRERIARGRDRWQASTAPMT